MEMESSLNHVMLVSFPFPGHINPLLRLGKLIASKGTLVTFVTSEEPYGDKMREANKIQDGELKPIGLGFLRFEFYQDRLTDDITLQSAYNTSRPQVEAVGKQEIKKLVKKYEKQPVTCLINNPFVPWVCDVAEELHIPSAILWVQSTACFAVYYYYHHQLVQFPTEDMTVEIPFLPLLKHEEIPSFLHPSSPFGYVAKIILEQFERLHKSYYVLIETFEELERDIIEHMSHLCPNININPIGPLFMMTKTINTDIKGDISDSSDDCMEWLDSKEPSSVVYISFGTVVYLKQKQVDEIAHGLAESSLSFVWVVRPPMEGFNQEPYTFPEGFEEKGKIVEWCPQERVLAHPAVACFLSHCGWNSTVEALSCGVPMVCFPQWGDQVTNAVYLVDVTKTGVRLIAAENDISRKVVAEKLLEATVGEKAAELRENSRRWKEGAEAAVASGGSSDTNFGEFVDKLIAVKVTNNVS